MRVTNERVKELMQSNTVTISSVADIRDLCHDIIVAREFIDKQEAIIKEMRGIIRRYVKLDTKCEVQDNLNSNATSILEKTKEYAE